MKTEEGNPRERFLNWICPLPKPHDTAEEFDRCHHRDLSVLTDAELLRERDRVRLRLTLDDRPADWFGERLRELQRTIYDRQRSGSPALPEQSV